MFCSWMLIIVFFFKQMTAYEMRISDWSSDVCSSDLLGQWRFAAVDRRKVHGEAAFRTPTSRPCPGLRPRECRSPTAARDGLGVRRLRFRILACAGSEERRVGKECISTCRSRL